MGKVPLWCNFVPRVEGAPVTTPEAAARKADRQPCSHGQITAYPSNNPYLPGWAECGICHAQLTNNARLTAELEAMRAAKEAIAKLAAAFEAKAADLATRYFHPDLMTDALDRAELAESALEAMREERDEAVKRADALAAWNAPTAQVIMQAAAGAFNQTWQSRAEAAESALEALKGKAELTDEARKYVARHAGGMRTVDVIKPQDARDWLERYEAIARNALTEVEGGLDG